MRVILFSVQGTIKDHRILGMVERIQECRRKNNQRSSNTGYGGEASRTRGNLRKSKFYFEY